MTEQIDNNKQTFFSQNIQPANQLEDDEIESDLFQLLGELKRHFLKILAAAILGGAIAFCISRYAITPQFTSTSMMYILSKETTLTSLADLQIGTQLTNDYKTIIVSRPVLQEVVDKLALPYTYKNLSKKVTIDNPQNTRIITITGEDPDPEMAKSITDAIAETSSDFIGDIMEMVPPKIIESGEIPILKSSPSNTRNAVIGAVIGAFLVCALVTVRMLLNDTIVNSDDVTRYLGLSVLASVPEREITTEEEKNEKNFRKKKKKKQ